MTKDWHDLPELGSGACAFWVVAHGGHHLQGLGLDRLSAVYGSGLSSMENSVVHNPIVSFYTVLYRKYAVT